MFFESNELVETQRRHLTRHIVGQSRSPVTISVIIIAFAAARETTAVIVADASRVVLTRGVGVLGVVLQFGKIGHENVVIDERNVWIGLIICAFIFYFLVNYSYLRARLGDRAACFCNRTSWWKREDDN